MISAILPLHNTHVLALNETRQQTLSWAITLLLGVLPKINVLAMHCLFKTIYTEPTREGLSRLAYTSAAAKITACRGGLCKRIYDRDSTNQSSDTTSPA